MGTLKKFITLVLLLFTSQTMAANPSVLSKTAYALAQMASFVPPAIYAAQLYNFVGYQKKLPVACAENNRFARKTLKEAEFSNEFIENLVIREDNQNGYFGHGNTLLMPSNAHEFLGVYRWFYPKKADYAQYCIVNEGIRSYKQYPVKKWFSLFGIAISIHGIGEGLKTMIPSLATNRLRYLAFPVKLLSSFLGTIAYSDWEKEEMTDELIQRIKTKGPLECALEEKLQDKQISLNKEKRLQKLKEAIKNF